MESYRILQCKCARKSLKEFEELKELLVKHPASYRKVNPNDSFRVGVPVLVIHTTGRGNRDRYYHGHEFQFADFGIVGKKFADAYIYRSLDVDHHGYAKRFTIDSDQIIVCL